MPMNQAQLATHQAELSTMNATLNRLQAKAADQVLPADKADFLAHLDAARTSTNALSVHLYNAPTQG